MTYKRIGFSSIIFIIMILFALAFVCFVAFSSTFGYSNSKNTFGESPQSVPKLTVIIDPGHGGADPGACANELFEKELNLNIALKLGEMLKLADVHVVYTRNEDVMLGDGKDGSKKTNDLKARLEIAENTDNCIFISIHMNKFGQDNVRGLQVFYGSKSPLSVTLAEEIQNSCKAIDFSNNRKVKPDGGNIYILEKTTKTAVLVECGFISNSFDASNLASDEYQNKLAFCIYNGIINFINGR